MSTEDFGRKTKSMERDNFEERWKQLCWILYWHNNEFLHEKGRNTEPKPPKKSSMKKCQEFNNNFEA